MFQRWMTHNSLGVDFRKTLMQPPLGALYLKAKAAALFPVAIPRLAVDSAAPPPSAPLALYRTFAVLISNHFRRQIPQQKNTRRHRLKKKEKER